MKILDSEMAISQSVLFFSLKNGGKVFLLCFLICFKSLCSVTQLIAHSQLQRARAFSLLYFLPLLIKPPSGEKKKSFSETLVFFILFSVPFLSSFDLFTISQHLFSFAEWKLAVLQCPCFISVQLQQMRKGSCSFITTNKA